MPSPTRVLAVTLPVFAVLVARFRFVCDDAFITFRYARNLAEGAGLRYNPDVHPPVEGYSEFLWALWLALGESAGANPVLWATVTSALCGALVIVLLARLLVRRFPEDPWAAPAGVLFAAAFPPLAVWSTGGLATAPFALAVFVCFERLLGDDDRPRPLAAGMAGATAVLLRADGIAAVAGVLVATGAVALRGRRTELRRAVGIAAAIVFAVFAAHVAWRYGYHGDFLPNTARVKVAFGLDRIERGATYVLSYLSVFPAAALVPATAIPFLWRPCRSRPIVCAALIVLGAVYGYAIVVGGDFMSMGRFLVPAVPFTALLLAALIAERPRGIGAAVPILVALCVATSLAPAFDLHAVPASVRDSFHFRRNRPGAMSEYKHWESMKENAERLTRLGRALGLVGRGEESIVLKAIGAVGYHSRLVIFDQHGLIHRDGTDPVRRRPSGGPLRSPGHDNYVERERFARARPTYWHAWMTGTEAARQGLAERNRTIHGARYVARAYEFPVEAGFEPGRSLVVLKLVARTIHEAP